MDPRRRRRGHPLRRPGRSGLQHPTDRVVRAARLLVPGSAERADRPATLTIAVAAAVLAVAVSLLRQPGRALDNIWAEDGRVFLVQAWNAPLWQTLPESYNGYLHVYPRLVASVAAALPVGSVAVVMALGGALAAAIAAGSAVIGSEAHLPSLAARAGLGIAVGLFPAAGYEIAGNTANAHWYLMAATFWLLLWTPRSWVGTAAATVTVLAAAGSDPLTGLFLPLALVRLVAGGRGSRIVVAGFVVGLAVQVPTALGGGVSPPPGATPRLLAGAYLRRVVAVAVTGFRAPHAPGRAVLAISAVAVVAVAAVAVAASRRHRVTVALVATSLAFSFVTFVVPVRLRWSAAFLPGGHSTLGSRYVLVGWLLLITVGAAAVDALTGRWAGRTVPAALLWLAWPAAVLAICLPTLHSGELREPSLTDQLPAVRASCRGQAPAAAERLAASPGPKWTFTVPCSRLRTGR